MATGNVRDLLLAVWREACRHIEIRQSTGTIARLLADWMPIDALLVYELDVRRSRLETVAVGSPRQRASLESGARECSSAEAARLLAWCRRGEVAHRVERASSGDDWAPCVPKGAHAEALIGPLESQHGPQGVLVVLARPEARFETRHAELVRTLLDPLAVALENHHRLHELTALREAAEAEKQSLLTRLGRTQAGETIVRADGGTLFLDEIGDLPPAVQVRLLRVLQDGYLERIGGQEPIKVDTRIVTATHRDLTAMVREGRFREDLWYRIAVFPVLLPPLRERREDIPALARHFAERAAIRFGLTVQMPTAQDMAGLLAYAWPGNVRELAAVIDRAAILGNGARLEVAKALGIAPAPTPRSTNAPVGHVAGATEGVEALDAATRQHIESALAVALGRIEGPHGAARLLKVNPHTLRARMRKLGIDWRRFRPEGARVSRLP